LAGWPAQLAASAFNQLGQYVNSPGHGPNVMQNLLFSSLAVAVTIASTYFAYSWTDDHTELTWVTGYIPRGFIHLQMITHPSIKPLTEPELNSWPAGWMIVNGAVNHLGM